MHAVAVRLIGGRSAIALDAITSTSIHRVDSKIVEIVFLQADDPAVALSRLTTGEASFDRREIVGTAADRLEHDHTGRACAGTCLSEGRGYVDGNAGKEDGDKKLHLEVHYLVL